MMLQKRRFIKYGRVTGEQGTAQDRENWSPIACRVSRPVISPLPYLRLSAGLAFQASTPEFRRASSHHPVEPHRASPVRIRMSTPKMSNRQIIDGWKEAVSERTDALQSPARSDYSIIPGFVIENPSRFGEVLSSNLTQTMATISSPSVADAMIFQSIGNRLWKHDARFKAALVVFPLTMC